MYKMKFANWINLMSSIILTITFINCSDDENKTEGTISSFVVKTTVSGSPNIYSGLTIQFGISDNTEVLANSTINKDGKATLPIDLSEYANKTIWLCIPGIVKYFHPLTQAEVEAKTLTLPDKDKGSTLQTAEGSPQAGGKYYVNDWIVALYMGVNKGGNSDIPLYWASGNLIATKINAEGSDNSEVVFHIATADESKAESLDKNYGGTGNSIIANTADAYTPFPIGTQWDIFGYGDSSGKKLYDTDKLEQYLVATKQWQGSFIVYDTNTDKEYDIAHVQLAGTWRTPTGGKGFNEFAAFEDDSEEYLDLKPDGTRWLEDDVSLGYKYEYEVKIGSKTITTNTLYFPSTGYRHAAFEGGRGYSGWYWSSTADPTGTPPYVPNGSYTGTVTEKTTAFNFGFMGSTAQCYPHPRTSGQSIRPVSE